VGRCFEGFDNLGLDLMPRSLENRRDAVDRRRVMVACLGLAALMTGPTGCNPPSEGRPAGSIHIDNVRTKASDVDAVKGKATQTKVKRP
jgi:hypothetical protein